MASGQTKHYGLNQWQAGDHVLREEFNEDNAKIDAALAQVPVFVAGTYVGTGEGNRTINLGGPPKMVYVCDGVGRTVNSKYYYGGMALPGHPTMIANANLPVLELCDTGFIVHRLYSDPYLSYAYSNESGMTYHYLAVL